MSITNLEAKRVWKMILGDMSVKQFLDMMGNTEAEQAVGDYINKRTDVFKWVSGESKEHIREKMIEYIIGGL